MNNSFTEKTSTMLAVRYAVCSVLWKKREKWC